jgi:hypothetical protein
MPDKIKLTPPSRALLALEARALVELGWFWQSLGVLRTVARGDGHPVMVLPGFTATDISTAPLRWYLRDRGYAAYGWRLGCNFGLREGVEQRMIRRLRDLHEQSGEKVSLVGWSLGGIYARELARQQPHRVRQVITLGSPFNLSNKANHAWRLYERLSGQTIDSQPEQMNLLRAPLEVPATAIYSRSDGVVAWQTCIDDENREQTQNIEVPGSHCGLGHNPMVLYVIADRLSQPPDAWKPFDRSGLRKLVYPRSVASPAEALATGDLVIMSYDVTSLTN